MAKCNPLTQLPFNRLSSKIEGLGAGSLTSVQCKWSDSARRMSISVIQILIYEVTDVKHVHVIVLMSVCFAWSLLAPAV